MGTTGPTMLRPLAAYTYTPCVMCMVPGDAVFFSANTTYPLYSIKSFTWNFGDGSANVTTTNPNTTHVFSNTLPGKWTVTLTVQDSSGQTDSISQQVLFNALPKFTIVPAHPMVGQPVVFNASSTIIYQTSSTTPGFAWSFGDGTSGSGTLVKHEYSTPSPYRVVLTVVTSSGNAQISKVLVVVSIVPSSVLVSNVRFDDTNITIYGTFTANQTSMTVTGSVTVTATNATTGDVIYSKSFNITLSSPSGVNLRFVLAVPTSPIWLGSTCIVNRTTGAATCFVSRDPDVTRDGTVNIIDVGMLAYKYGSSDPTLDLADTGTIGIVDAGLMAADYGVPIFS